MSIKRKNVWNYRGSAPAKVNIGLRVLTKRKDGYHNIETIFYPVKLADNIKFKLTRLARSSKSNRIGVKTNIPGTTNKKNICYKAAELFLNRFAPKEKYSVDITIQKNIPTGAGLGGGSSDAAWVLKILAKHFRVSGKEKEIKQCAAELGSDVPFFLYSKAAYGTGRGEKLTPLPVFKIKGKILIVNPAIHISTPWAYKQLGIKNSKLKILNKIKKADLTDERLMVNDFERVVFREYPKIEQIKYDMYRLGAVYSLMSGSGSTVFGIYNNVKDLNTAGRYFNAKKYKVFRG